MNRLEKSVGTILLAILLLLHGESAQATGIDLLIGQDNYRIELAISAIERQRGLMHRPRLGPRQGMLLVYSAPGDRRIWMKNVLMTLWVFWIDETYTILDKQRLQPCIENPCPVFGTRGKAKYVLELGDYEHSLVPGDKLEGLSDL